MLVDSKHFQTPPHFPRLRQPAYYYWLFLHHWALTWHWNVEHVQMGNTSSNGGFSLVMLVFRRVYFVWAALTQYCNPDTASCGPPKAGFWAARCCWKHLGVYEILPEIPWNDGYFLKDPEISKYPWVIYGTLCPTFSYKHGEKEVKNCSQMETLRALLLNFSMHFMTSHDGRRVSRENWVYP